MTEMCSDHRDIVATEDLDRIKYMLYGRMSFKQVYAHAVELDSLKVVLWIVKEFPNDLEFPTLSNLLRSESRNLLHHKLLTTEWNPETLYERNFVTKGYLIYLTKCGLDFDIKKVVEPIDNTDYVYPEEVQLLRWIEDGCPIQRDKVL